MGVENRQVEMALELVKFDPNLVRLRGRGGVTPLHLVVEKGDVELLTEFLMACPKSILDVNASGETAIHTAVMNGRYEELKALTGWIRRMRQSDAASIETDILDRKNRDGNTALHVAAYENKHEALYFWEYCSIRMTRYRSGISDGNRNALLVITILVITATYGTALQPPRALTGEDKGSDSSSTVVYLYNYEGKPRKISRALWGFNTMAFLSALALNFVLLPLGREYTWFYILISAPLCCSYGLAMYLNDNDTAYFQFFLALAIMVALPCYILFIFLKWKWPRKVGTPKPKSQIILKGWSTMV
ncbi:unnamed protein product [Thlaspi arvense]|uniref:PGG domain-containing protein n=1 Tax=Thlaspi arvense TaxID=13288 RepID=A0AAU9RVB2_THLAR|nr:unnamed protein product [Thlaspi arvense]